MPVLCGEKAGQELIAPVKVEPVILEAQAMVTHREH